MKLHCKTCNTSKDKALFYACNKSHCKDCKLNYEKAKRQPPVLSIDALWPEIIKQARDAMAQRQRCIDAMWAAGKKAEAVNA